MGFPKVVKHQLWKLKFLYRTNAPIWVISASFSLNNAHRISNKLSDRGRAYVAKLNAFRATKDQLKLDNDWFTRNIPTWLRAFDEEKVRDKPRLDCLEIGSWQGLSAFFTLSELPNAYLTCVDTWEGADEHKDGTAASAGILSEVERTFDSNLSVFGDRLRKYKGTSFSYFNERFEPNCFDMIYVDGSHHSDDVIVDAIKSFEMLKVGGLLIFDDYLWDYYKREIDNPAGAINSFLRMKKHQLKIICFDYQLIIKKTAESVRFSYGQ